MASRLPTMFKLPGYTIFEYRPRYYDEKKDRREKTRRSIKIRERAFERDSILVDNFRKEKVDIRKKSILLSNIIRTVIVVLFCAICYFIARAFGLLLLG
ncbi:MAG: hypothetical protein HOD63_03495 [Bacteroidetes bacterium]|jgi:hypothetical protein|nr:hypothetical protein [Bacteroidota bacterium]MBT5530932.1 hypothetical protein [Cytophagia bacterium]MBT3424085.1 hypothetical protein [Bacteroidota bacterium]MBT3933793.1 hypothetical protein [Bacteroidota bacterium]MBT4337631.1 hypothetical protein [Bacteroidota bacterium]